MYFPIPGHPLGNENILLSCPPPVLHNTWGGHDSRKFLVSCPPPVLSNTGGGHDSRNIFVSCPPHVLANTGEGHEIDLFLLISGTLSFQALIKLITMWTLCVWLGRIGEYHLHSSKLGSIRTSGLRPSVHIEPQFLRIQMVFPNTSSPDAQYSIKTNCSLTFIWCKMSPF